MLYYQLSLYSNVTKNNFNAFWIYILIMNYLNNNFTANYFRLSKLEFRILYTFYIYVLIKR